MLVCAGPQECEEDTACSCLAQLGCHLPDLVRAAPPVGGGHPPRSELVERISNLRYSAQSVDAFPHGGRGHSQSRSHRVCGWGLLGGSRPGALKHFERIARVLGTQKRLGSQQLRQGLTAQVAFLQATVDVLAQDVVRRVVDDLDPNGRICLADVNKACIDYRSFESTRGDLARAWLDRGAEETDQNGGENSVHCHALADRAEALPSGRIPAYETKIVVSNGERRPTQVTCVAFAGWVVWLWLSSARCPSVRGVAGAPPGKCGIRGLLGLVLWPKSAP